MASPWDGSWFKQIEAKPTTKFTDYARCIIKLPGFSAVQQEIFDIPVNENDVWIISFPTSGSTLIQELVWLLTHNLDYERAKVTLSHRTIFLDSAFTRYFRGEEGPPNLAEFEGLRNQLTGRRIMTSHLQWLHLPTALTRPNSPAKMIYVARNPKDICVSYYNKHRTYKKFVEDHISFDDFAQAFVSDQVFYSPYWPHFKEFWYRRNDPNVLLVKYEDMIKNLDNVIKEVAEYLKVPAITDDQLHELKNHLSFENMSKNPAVSREEPREVRRDDENCGDGEIQEEGKVGVWQRRMSPEITEKFNAWIKKNTLNSDITFLEK